MRQLIFVHSWNVFIPFPSVSSIFCVAHTSRHFGNSYMVHSGFSRYFSETGIPEFRLTPALFFESIDSNWHQPSYHSLKGSYRSCACVCILASLSTTLQYHWDVTAIQPYVVSPLLRIPKALQMLIVTPRFLTFTNVCSIIPAHETNFYLRGSLLR